MTTEKQIPPWGQDELSTFFQSAEYNDRVTSLKFPPVFSLLQGVDAAFRQIADSVEKDSRQEFLIPRLLIARTHSSFLASIRLSMSGQVPEACAVLRASIEQAWYALHLAKDPNPPERVTVWLRRNDDEFSKSKCKNEFKIRNVRSTHQSFDSVTAKQLHELYEMMIDLGAHPNQQGVLTSMNLSETEEETTCQVGLLAPKVTTVLVALKTAVETAIGTFKVFHLIFPERFKIMGLDVKIEILIGELNRVFKAYLSQFDEAAGREFLKPY
jgi:hypothetical protein